MIHTKFRNENMNIKKDIYEEKLKSIKEYCKDDIKTMSDVLCIEYIITYMYDVLKHNGLILDKNEYTKEELKKLKTNDIENLCSDVINDVTDVYAELSKTDSIEISLVFIEFRKQKNTVKLTFYNHVLNEYANCTLTDDEFFNNDLTYFKKRFKNEYVSKKELELKKYIKELDEKKKEYTEELNKLHSL